MANTAHKGRRLEHEVRKMFMDAGWNVMRGAASKGMFAGFKADLVVTIPSRKWTRPTGQWLEQQGWTVKAGKIGIHEAVRKTARTARKIIMESFLAENATGTEYLVIAIQCKVSKA